MGRMTSKWKTCEINYPLEWCWRTKLRGCRSFAWYCNKEITQVPHRDGMLPLNTGTNFYTAPDTELMFQEFSADTSRMALHPHTQGHLPTLLELSWGLSLVFSSATRLWSLWQRLPGLFIEYFWVSPTVALSNRGVFQTRQQAHARRNMEHWNSHFSKRQTLLSVTVQMEKSKAILSCWRQWKTETSNLGSG